MKALSDIYFYNALGLANDLKDRTVSETRALKHLIASLVVGGIGFDVPIEVNFQQSASGWGGFIAYIALFIISGVISYYGTWLTYQVNSKGDGEDFFLRFASLTLPIGIQLAVLFLGVGLLLSMLAMALTSALGEWGIYLTGAGFYLAAIVFIAMFFIRMRRYIGVASGAEND